MRHNYPHPQSLLQIKIGMHSRLLGHVNSTVRTIVLYENAIKTIYFLIWTLYSGLWLISTSMIQVKLTVRYSFCFTEWMNLATIVINYRHQYQYNDKTVYDKAF